ncbi:MAG: methylenetetrahydrofolate reductase C-terminal domain-containing protein, partial [Anaerolineales bacterium]|nr:methylenetetrahydrofolate reductase C-terminal domain-containing protein [Anaerolineales bacterium]
PCGGVRQNGHCEVKPEMVCVWVEAYQRSLKMPKYGHQFASLQPPMNNQLKGSSSWINMFYGLDLELPPGWVHTKDIPVKLVKEDFYANGK